MPAPERRAEIVAATLPLLLAHGSAVTTRQIAEAAGIAEGTIFRVFPDKETLIEAVLERVLDTGALDEAIEAIDPTLPLEAATRRSGRDPASPLRRHPAAQDRDRDDARLDAATTRADLGALAALFEPDRDQLRRDPLEAAHLLRGMTIAGTHPALILDEPLSPAEIVSLFLDGVRRETPDPSDRRDHGC